VVLVVDPATRRVTVYRSAADVTVRAGDEPSIAPTRCLASHHQRAR